MRIKAYAVIYTCDRETSLLATELSKEAAEAIMKSDFLEVFLDNGFEQADFDNNMYAGDEWAYLEGNGAWLNGRCSTDHDWRIIEIDVAWQNKDANKFYEAVDEVCLNCSCTEKSCNHCPVRRTYEAVKRRAERGAKVCVEN